MRLLVCVFLLLCTSQAFAQSPQQPVPYAPLTLNAADWTALQSYLNDQPAKFSIPLLNFFNQREQTAQIEAKAKADAAAKKPPAPPAVPPKPPKPSKPTAGP